MNGELIMETNQYILAPSDPTSVQLFREKMFNPNIEKPITEMNDETARDLKIIWASIKASAKHWQGGREDIQMPGQPINRKEYWDNFSANHVPVCLPLAKEFVSNSSGSGKLAIDLGSGNSPIVKDLLQKGWRVIAVDSSRLSLYILGEKNNDALKSGLLTLIEADVTSFTPSEPVDLVIAADIFPYINPAKFQDLWIKIHDVFLKKDGFLIGSIFRTIDCVPMMNAMKETGAWFLQDRRMIRPLLASVGYETIKCTFRKDSPETDPNAMQFIAKKLS